ncbi:MAG: type II toxin-antitoxin system CcdA family antitoxin [Methanoregula sp.]|jgi:hypothetical protein
MTNSVTTNIPYPIVVEARRLGINISEVARDALRQKIAEEQKSEKATGGSPSPDKQPPETPHSLTPIPKPSNEGDGSK